MPIVRREEQPDRLSPQLLYLWQRRWTLLLPALIAAVAAYSLTYLLKEEFVVTAEVYANRLVPINDELQPPSPVAAARLLESDLLLRRVRDDYARRFSIPPANLPIEKFSRMFQVKTEVLRDTAVEKEVSPVMQLSLQTQGREEARFIMESWLHNFIDMFGNYATAEAVQKREALLMENEALEERLAAAESDLERARSGLPVLQKMALTLTNVLAPADLPSQAAPALTLGRPSGVVTGSNTQVNLSVGSTGEGLMARLVQLNIEELMAADGASSRPLAQVRSEQAAVSAVIDQTQTSATALHTAAAEAAARVSTLERQIQMLTLYQAELRERLNHFAVAAAMFRKPQGEGFAVGGDVRVLAGPVTPEHKAWPTGRTLTGLAAGAFVFILSAVLLLGLKALRRAAAREEADNAPVGAEL